MFTLGNSERAQILPDGSLGPWQLAGNLAVPRYQSVAVAAGGYLYLLGGSPIGGGIIANIERAAVMADGSLGPWTQIAPLPVARTVHAAATTSSHVYVLGGAVGDATYKSVIYAKVLPDGSLGSWEPTSSLTRFRYWSGAGVVDGTLYAIGGLGDSAANCADVEAAPILADGSLGAWAVTTATQTPRCYAETGASATHLYAISGYSGEPVASGLTSVEYTSPVGPISATVSIDIKPGSFPNSINPRSQGVIPVAILTDTFDATTVDPLSVKFGRDGATESHGRSHIEDVDSDGDLDLILHFRTQDTGIQCGNTSASLTGETFNGAAIKGSDSIRTVGCK